MSKKKLLIAAGASTAALLLFGLIFTLVVGGSGFGTDEKLRFAMELLDEGRWDVPGHMARQMAEDGQIEPDTNAAWQYVQGVSKLQSVENNLDSPKNRRVLLEAIDHLSKADQIGFPTGYQGKGKYYKKSHQSGFVHGHSNPYFTEHNRNKIPQNNKRIHGPGR